MKIDLNIFAEIKSFQQGIELVKAISDLGYETCMAGGCVRDIVRFVTGQTDTIDLHDIDIATAAPLLVLKEHFHTASNNGEAHGTILVKQGDTMFEVTHFRTDGAYSDGRHPDSVELVETFREDAMRRDFTINAMGLTWDGEVLDYYKGVEHIQQKVICAVGDPCLRFSEDALRIVRGCRFAANFGYDIEFATMASMQLFAKALETISNERFRGEFLKLRDYKECLPDFLYYLNKVRAFPHIPAFAVNRLSYGTVLMMVDRVKLLTRENLFPVLAYAGTEENLMQFVPTREEKALYRWLKKYENLFGSDVITRGHMWTNLVELASGDYQTVFDLNDAEDSKVVWYVEHFPRALFIVQNPPDLSMLSQRVKAMGIPQGKEFGDTVKSFTELAYVQMATSIPVEKVEERGNSRIVYTLSSVSKKGA